MGGDDLFGTDENINRNGTITKQAGASQVSGLPDAGYFGGGLEHGIGDLTGNHIDFVTIGDGDQHIRIVRTGLFQDRWKRGLAMNRANIQFFL